LPLAVTMTTEKIYSGFLGKFDEFKTFFHGHTYTANPLACAAALASLDIFKEEKTLEKLAPKIKLLTGELSALAELPWAGDVRQCGFMAGIELVMDKATGKDFPAKDKIGAKVCAACRPHGVMLRPLGNVIVILPPLSLSASELKRMMHVVQTAIKEVLEGYRA